MVKTRKDSYLFSNDKYTERKRWGEILAKPKEEALDMVLKARKSWKVFVLVGLLVGLSAGIFWGIILQASLEPLSTYDRAEATGVYEMASILGNDKCMEVYGEQSHSAQMRKGVDPVRVFIECETQSLTVRDRRE